MATLDVLTSWLALTTGLGCFGYFTNSLPRMGNRRLIRSPGRLGLMPERSHLECPRKVWPDGSSLA